MRIEQLEYLEAVTRHGSLRRAGERLHLSQPALSESISSLERELGVSLLDRHRSGSRISRAGQELLPHMTAVLDAVAELRRAAGHAHTAARTLRVGTVNAGTSSLLAPTIQRFGLLHSAVDVDVASSLPRAVHEGLVDGSLDLGLVNALPGDDVPPTLHGTVLLRGRPAAVLRTDDPLTEKAEVTVDDLRSRPFVAMREGYLMHRLAHRLFGSRPPVVSCSADGAENGKYLVAAGMGAAVLPDYSVIGDPLHQAGVLTTRPLEGVDTPVSLLALRRAGSTQSASVLEFERLLIEVAAEHAQGRTSADRSDRSPDRDLLATAD